MSTPKIHWYDSETTGVNSWEQQMLTFAMVTTDLQLNHLALMDEKIRLLPAITPTKEALNINKLDPYSLEWHATSMEETHFCDKLTSYLQTNYTEGDVFIAYSARFDNSFIKEAFKRSNKHFYAKSVICLDPLIMVKQAVSQKKILPKQVYSKKMGWYHPSKLELVAELLLTKHNGPAHQALNDVYTLIKTTPKVYEILTGGKTMEHFLKENQYRIQF